MAFIGWFLGGAVRAEEQLATARGALAGVRVRDAMTPSPAVVPASATVADVLADITTRLRFLRQVPPERRATTQLAQIVRPRGDLVTVAPDEPLAELLGRLSAGEDGRALVLDRERLVGIVSPTDIMRALTAADLRGHRPYALG